MIYLLYTIHVLVCLFLILVVLLQQGKGADLSVFGGGATQAAFGARGAVNLLHKLTVMGFVAFIMTTITIGFMTSSKKTSSVLSNIPAAEEVGESEEALLFPDAEAAETEALGEIPGESGDSTNAEGDDSVEEGSESGADDEEPTEQGAVGEGGQDG